MKQRDYGSTGVRLSVIGFGGILVMNESPEGASRLVAQAIDRGVNYFDVAPSYGNAQQRLGPALEPYRNQVFLACKTQVRDAEGARAQLEESLRDLRTDHLDLYQLHAVTSMEDVDTILGPGGAMETFLRAREEGLVRFLGFSAHSEEAALALMDAVKFDSILFPVNWVVWYGTNFGPRVVDRATRDGLAILALKALAKRSRREGEEDWPKAWYHPVDSYDEAELGLRFTLSRPVAAAVSPGHEQLFNWACDAAEAFRPLTDEEEAMLARQAEALEPIFPVA